MAQQERATVEMSAETIGDLIDRSRSSFENRPSSLISWNPGSIDEPAPPYALSLHEETRGYVALEPSAPRIQVLLDQTIRSWVASPHLNMVDLATASEQEMQQLHQQSVVVQEKILSRGLIQYRSPHKYHKGFDPTLTYYARPVERRFSDEYRVVVVGGGGTGKSGLVIQLIQSHFVDDYDPTIEDSYRRRMIIDEKFALLDVLDTAGQEEYSAMKKQYMRTGEGFVCVYSITSRASFEEMRELYEEIAVVKGVDQWPCVLVANHCEREMERMVSKEEGQQLARKLNCDFYETSLQGRTNVEEPFISLVRSIREYDDYKGPPSPSPPSPELLAATPSTRRGSSWWARYRRTSRQDTSSESQGLSAAGRKIDRIVEETS